jgi:glycosyltransferase involved in cell wall biosynthesis
MTHGAAPALATASTTESAAPRGVARRRMRLLFVTITFHPEPGALRGLPLAKRLVESGEFEVTVLTAVPWYPLGRTYPGYRQRAWQWETLDGVRVLRVPIYPSHDASAVRRMATYVSYMMSALVFGLPQVGPVDAIYHVDNLPTTGLITLLLSRLRGVPVVQHVADLWPESVTGSGMLPKGVVGRAIASTLQRVCDFVYRRDDHLTVLSPGFKRALVARGVPAERIDVLHNWAEEDRFFSVPYDMGLARELGVVGKFNVIYAGNIGPLQELETVVRAAALLRDLEDVQIVIVGSGTREADVRALAETLDARNVLFLGRRPLEEMNAINALADVLLVHLADIPFLHSTVPSKVQVALVSGKPVLLGVRGDAAELIEASGGGVTFEPGNAESLALRLRELHARPASALREMGERGRAYYFENLSLDIGYRRMAKLFTDVRPDR